jgi:MEMO1 family protein
MQILQAGDQRSVAMIIKIIIAAFGIFAGSAFMSGQLSSSYAAETVKAPNVAGTFYPDNAADLSAMIDGFMNKAEPQTVKGDIFGLICPHAGYVFSGPTAAYGYKLIKDKAYKTVVVIGPSHSNGFTGVSVYPQGSFRTPLGGIEIDRKFARMLLNQDPDIVFEPKAFEREHSVEVQLPFLQRTLKGFKIVPIVMGACDFNQCSRLAGFLKSAIAGRKDVLVIASSDMYHGYDYDECEIVDDLTLSYLAKMDEDGLYKGLLSGKLQMCGALPVVTTIMLAKSLGHEKAYVLSHTNSAIVTGKKIKGSWTVGYSSIVIDREKGAGTMLLTKEQQKKMLDLARNSIETYLKTGKKLQVSETDPVLMKEMGAFVTLHRKGQLRGCIGNIVGRQPLYLTIRDMAVESATGDPRFTPVKLADLKDIDIEISVLSPLEKVESADKIEMGVHGVIVRRGYNSGVFLPQVATETGWSKEEFLSQLCSQKAGLPPDAWKDKNTELLVFTAEVFK